MRKMEMETRRELGIHTIIEFYGCNRKVLANSRKVEEIFRKASKVSKATILKTTFHHFDPVQLPSSKKYVQGVSGVVIIAESHFSVHTWPEYGYAAIDFFSCSPRVDIDNAIEYLRKNLKPKYLTRLDLRRGMIFE